MRGQSFPHAVRAPPLPGGNLNKNLYQYYCRTDIPFICCRCSLATIVGYDDDFWSAGASSLDTVHCLLLDSTDFWSTSWTRVHFSVAAILLWGHLLILIGHCRPTIGADGHPVMLVVVADLYGVFVQVSPSGHSC